MSSRNESPAKISTEYRKLGLQITHQDTDHCHSLNRAGFATDFLEIAGASSEDFVATQPEALPDLENFRIRKVPALPH